MNLTAISRAEWSSVLRDASLLGDAALAADALHMLRRLKKSPTMRRRQPRVTAKRKGRAS